MTDAFDDRFLNTLQARARQALAHWDLHGQEPVLLKYRENAVFRIQLADGAPAALRIHRSGYHDETALRSELQWMRALHDGGLAVPVPIPGSAGDALVHLPAAAGFAAQHADIVTWMKGTPLGASGTPLAYSSERQITIFRALGAMMARMHNFADRWQLPATFRRAAWDLDGLVGETPLWGRFWDCQGLSQRQKSALRDLRHRLVRDVSAIAASGFDYGLIHADLVRENVLLTDDDLQFIDFDDCGFGFRMFDIATALIKNRGEAAYDSIARALLAGYQSERPLSRAAISTLPLFLVLRSATYIGWLAERPEMPNAQARLARYADETLDLAATLKGTSFE